MLEIAIMKPLILAYGSLALAIVCEVTGSTFLQKSEQFTKSWPTAMMALCFIASLYFLSLALKMIPLGVAYAIWAGLGIVLTALVSVTVFRNTLDGPALAGMGLIVTGVVVMNLFSKTVTH